MSFRLVFAAAILTLGMGLSASSVFAGSYASPIGDPATAGPGGSEDDGGLPNSLEERQRGVAPSYNDDPTTGTIAPNRWRGIHRPANGGRAERAL